MKNTLINKIKEKPVSPVVEKMYSRDELLDIVIDYEMRMSGYKEKSKEWYKTRIDAWLRNHYPQ